MSIASTAYAQDARDGEVSAQRFQPAIGPGNFVTVERARVSDSFTSSGAIIVDYARDPFRLRHCLPTSCSAPGATLERVHVIRDLAAADLMASVTPIPRLQLGLRLPILHASGDGVVTDRASAQFGRAQPGGISTTTVSDPTFEAKVRALGTMDSAFAAGASLTVSAPLGHALAPDTYAGDSSPSVGLRAIADVQVGRAFFGVNAGALFRKVAHLGTLDLGPEARAGLGAGVHVTDDVRALAEVYGSSNLSTDAGTNAAETDAAVQYAPDRGRWVATIGGGAGLNQGLGAPTFRVFAGVGLFVERAADKAAGAPDPDLDHDGIVNEEDKCPREGGDVVHLAGPYYGCPKRDSDEDGVLDHVDACPDKPGVATQDPKTNGCPSNDRDHDGIPNDVDKCPDEPETYNGLADEDGCPDSQTPIVVEVRNDQIVVINEHINFEFNSDKIVGKRSFEALDLVAEVIRKHPEIRRIEVAGHTDNVGPRDENLSISKRRAAAVASYLASKGVAGDRLVSSGFGPDKPVADNGTPEGRAQNRRVQFNILLMSK